MEEKRRRRRKKKDKRNEHTLSKQVSEEGEKKAERLAMANVLGLLSTANISSRSKKKSATNGRMVQDKTKTKLGVVNSLIYEANPGAGVDRVLVPPGYFLAGFNDFRALSHTSAAYVASKEKRALAATRKTAKARMAM